MASRRAPQVELQLQRFPEAPDSRPPGAREAAGFVSVTEQLRGAKGVGNRAPASLTRCPELCPLLVRVAPRQVAS